MTVTEKVKAGLLAPSTPLKPSDVFHFIFGWVEPFDMRGIHQIIMKSKSSQEDGKTQDIKDAQEEGKTQDIEDAKSSQEEGKAQDIEDAKSSQEQGEDCLTVYTTIFNLQNVGTLDLGTKEASGSPRLGVFMLCVKSAMERQHPSYRFFVEHQYTVRTSKTYYADSALVAIVTGSLPIFVVEYKPRIPAGLENVEPSHLSEAFLQAFYTTLSNGLERFSLLFDDRPSKV